MRGRPSVPNVPIAGSAMAAATLGIAIGGVLLNMANRTPIDITAVAVVSFLAFPAMGWLILRHRPGHPIGYLLLAIGLNVYIIFASQDYARFALRHPGTLPLEPLVAWTTGWNWIPFAALVLLFLPLLFPTGRLLSRRWLTVLAAGAVFEALAFLGNAFVPGPSDRVNYPDVINPLGIPGHGALFTTLQNLALPFGILALIGSVTSVVVRYRRADGVQRHQLRWFLFALIVATIPFILQGSVPSWVAQTAVAFCIPLLPISIAIAVLRYRLYDIDVVINRALVYGTLAVFITLVYVAIVVGIGRLLGAANRQNVLLSIIATAIVAVAFQPVHARVQRIANRLVYGKRATPYEVMAGFARQMASTLAFDQVLPQLAEVAARGVNAVAARAVLFLPDGSQRAAVWPADAGHDTPFVEVAVIYKDEQVGRIEVRKDRGEPLTRSEQALLTDLVAQAGLVLHNARLAAELEGKLAQLMQQARELQASRQRIITAQEAERRRLGEEIRGGVQRQLEMISGRLAHAESMLDRDPDAVARQLQELAGLTQTALDSLRELARGIFPPILSDKGLLPALHAQLRKADAVIAVEAPAELESQRFDSGVETALYFTCVEAFRRAKANCAIRLEQEGNALRFWIRGLSADGEMQDSRDRIAAAGGWLATKGEDIEGLIPT
jgi:signal transduction histidine kinase